MSLQCALGFAFGFVPWQADLDSGHVILGVHSQLLALSHQQTRVLTFLSGKLAAVHRRPALPQSHDCHDQIVYLCVIGESRLHHEIRRWLSHKTIQ